MNSLLIELELRDFWPEFLALYGTPGGGERARAERRREGGEEQKSRKIQLQSITGAVSLRCPH